MDCARKIRNILTPTLSFITVLLMISVSSAEEYSQSDWFITLGMGAFHGPEYEGSDKAKSLASLDFEVVWKDRIFLNLDGLGINYYRKDTLVLNAIVSQGDERKESLSASLNGLGDIDASTTLTLGAEFELGLLLSYAHLTSHNGGTDGVQATVGLETSVPLQMLAGNLDAASVESMGETGDHIPIGPIITAGLSAAWADDNYSNGFFGVDAEQSASSGLPQYSAGAGFKSINLDLGILYSVNESWTARGFAGYNKLMGDAMDSPIVRDDDNVLVGVFITYHF